MLQAVSFIKHNTVVVALGMGCIQVTPVGLPGQHTVQPHCWCFAHCMQCTPLCLPRPQAASHITACIAQVLYHGSLPQNVESMCSLESIYGMVHGLCWPLFLIPQQLECRSGVPVSQTQESYVFLEMQTCYDNHGAACRHAHSCVSLTALCRDLHRARVRAASDWCNSPCISKWCH